MKFVKSTTAILASLIALAGFVFATETDITVGSAALPAYSIEYAKISAEVDFATYNMTTNDILNVIDVPSNCIVEAVYVSVVSTSTTTSATFDVGDGSDADGYKSNVSIAALSAAFTSAAQTMTFTTAVITNVPLADHSTTNLYTVVTGGTSAATGYTAGKLYTANDTIDITADGVLTDGIVQVVAIIKRIK